MKKHWLPRRTPNRDGRLLMAQQIVKRQRRTRRQSVLLPILLLMLAAAPVCMDIAHTAGMDARWLQDSRNILIRQETGSLPWATVKDHDVEFHAGPGRDYPVVRIGKYGSAVEILGEKNGWVQAMHWSCRAPVWIWGGYLERVS